MKKPWIFKSEYHQPQSHRNESRHSLGPKWSFTSVFSFLSYLSRTRKLISATFSVVTTKANSSISQHQFNLNMNYKPRIHA